MLRLVRERDETHLAGAVLLALDAGLSVRSEARSDGRAMEIRLGSVLGDVHGEALRLRTNAVVAVITGTITQINLQYGKVRYLSESILCLIYLQAFVDFTATSSG